MSRACVLIHELSLPGAATEGSPAASAWTLLRRLAGSGHEATLLHTGSLLQAAPADLRAEAGRIGAVYQQVDDQPAPYDVPLFPPAASHVLGHRVAAALVSLESEFCFVLDAPAHAAIALERNHTGVALSETTFVVVASQPPTEVERAERGTLPAPGFDEIVREFLDRRTYALAHEIWCATPALLARVREAGLVARDAGRVPSLADAASGRDPLASISRAATTAAHTLPRVSVVVPYFEQPTFLDEALASLATQTTPPHEVIVIDDGSRSAEAAAAFKAAETNYRRPGWTFVRQANAGPAAARNRAAEMATGDALLFCDSDNRFRPHMLETLGRALVRTNAAVVTCAFQAFASDPADRPADPGYVFAPLGPCVELALVENVLGDTNFLVRREVFRSLGGFPESNRAASEDWQFLLQLLRAGFALETVPAVLFDYRIVRGSNARRNTEFASARRAVDPFLSAAEPAWQRLWPHAVAALRDPAARRLEHELQVQRELTRQALEIARREVEVAREDRDRARRKARQCEWEARVQKAAATRAQAEAQAAEAGRGREAVRVAALEKQISRVERERDEELARRDDKIRRMQASLSWQVTAPGRALRRAILDPLVKAPEAPETPAAPAVEVRSAIDRPTFWDAAPAAGVISGWCLFGAGRPARSVRALVGSAELPGDHGLPRPDVGAAHQLEAESERCGFEFRYRLPVDADHAVRVEAQTEDGTWHALKDATLHTTSRPRDVHDYTAWVQSFGTVTLEKAAALRARLGQLESAQQPLISVLMPVHNPDERWLTRAIESVREQVYENWELCIADDASTAPHVRAVLQRIQAADPRVRVVFRPKNGHISAASNSALELVRGEFVALLDHDDELSPDALAEVVLLLARHPDTDVVFTDEDKIDEEGRRRTPYFKPDYLPDLLHGQNCLSHLSVYRTALVRTVGGFRVGYEGSQDWDLALRVVDRTTPERIRHIPKVLYHWRAISGSTAVTVSAKDYSIDAARRALADHFERRGIKADLRAVTGDHWQIMYPVPDPAPLVTIIIPTKNAADLLRIAVGSILARTEYPHFEIIVVNNQSDEADTLAFLDELRGEEDVRVLDYDAPFNFSAINNFAAEHARGEVLCFVNNDIEVITGRWLDELVSHALRPDIGAVGPMLYYPNQTIQHAGVVLGLGGIANHAFLHYRHGTDGYMNRARLAQNYSAVTGACLAVRRDLFNSVGGFNATDLPVAFNDIDLCLRLRARGVRNLWTPFAELYHHESASRGTDETPEKRARFQREIDYMQRTWGDLLARDPAYSPNLSLDLLGWALAWPPRT